MTARRRPRWGQHFLEDPAVARKIVEWAAPRERSVLEIGPGKGALSALLAERTDRLTLVEIDRELVASLRRRFAHTPVEIVEADVLALDLSTLAGAPFLVVANLPYETGTAIVRRLLAAPQAVVEAVVMLQKEVCARMLARHGDPQYGALSIYTALRADITAGPIVVPSSFRPRPQVDSQVIRLVPLPAPRWPVGSIAHFEAIVRTAFGGRRKMLRNTVGRWLGERVGSEAAAALMKETALDPTMRPQEVAPERFAQLAAGSYELLEGRAGTT